MPRGISSRIILVFALFSLLLLAGACSKAGFISSDVYRAGRDDAVNLIWEQDKVGQIVPKGFSHPAKIPDAKIRNILTSLKFSELVFFKWKDQGRVFIDSEVKKMTGPISEALGKANENQWVAFSVTSYKRDFLFKTKRLTSGWIWVKNDKLHLVFGNFRFELSHDADPYQGDPRERYAMTTYRIDPGDYSKPPVIDPKDKFLKREHLNWAVVDLTAVPAESTEKTAVPTQSVEERLEQLKGLLEKGLITQEEYEKKRQEILDSL